MKNSTATPLRGSATLSTDEGINKSNVSILAILHVLAIYGCVGVAAAPWQTLVTAFVLYVGTGLSITGGKHRLWAHKSYEATLPVKLFYVFFSTMAMAGSIIWWVRDHRVHHKFTDTDRDPYNAKRGFFYSHMGWLLLQKSEKVQQAAREVKMDDIYSDSLLKWQHRLYLWLAFPAALGIPTLFCGLLWGDYWGGFFIAGALRIIVTLHCTFCINSLAHSWGKKPDNPSITASDNLLLSVLTLGEGYHNYHHVYQYDYRGNRNLGGYNPTGWLIKLLSYVGLVSDLKVARQRRS